MLNILFYTEKCNRSDIKANYTLYRVHLCEGSRGLENITLCCFLEVQITLWWKWDSWEGSDKVRVWTILPGLHNVVYTYILYWYSMAYHIKHSLRKNRLDLLMIGYWKRWNL